MAAFTRILSIWPISISIAENIALGDLLKLSRMNSDCRCALHGFPLLPPPNSAPREEKVRSDLYIGEHQTSYWKGLKRAAIRECSEQNHTRGSTPQCCRRCSMPVCEACVVKENHKKNEPTFKNRCRYLCVDCWTFGNPHVGRHSTAPSPNPALSYNFAPGSGDFCVCTVKDGWLCVSCKNEQNAEARNIPKCAGEGCAKPLEEEKESRRICLWCDFPLIKKHHRSENRDPRKEYNFGFIFEGKTVDEEDPIKRTEARKKRRDARSSLQNRRIDRLFQPDYTGAQYVEHLAEIDYKALGAKKPSRKRITDSMQGIFKYDQDFMMQFQEVCMKQPSEDWYLWVVRLMFGEEDEGHIAETGIDEVASNGCVKAKKRKTDEYKYCDSTSTSTGKGKKPEGRDTESEKGIGHGSLDEDDEGIGGLDRLPLNDWREDDYFVVQRTEASETTKDDASQQDPLHDGRTDFGLGPKPPDYDMRNGDLLLKLDGPLNAGCEFPALEE